MPLTAFAGEKRCLDNNENNAPNSNLLCYYWKVELIYKGFGDLTIVE